ncbi:MAG: HD domain-containing protein [Abditibacteriota bacterium]|nr:HD domain-containing protein [Abditibacteriota bacterium]
MYDLNSLGAVSYAGLDLICVFIILSVGILRRYYLKGISTGAEWVIYTLSVCYSVNLICDAAWALGESSGAMSAPAFYAANSIYFITLIAGSACWFVYSMGALGRKWIQRRPLLILLALPSLAVVYLAVTAQSNGLLFYLSDAGKYERGSLFPLFAVINYGYLVVSALAGLAAAFHRKRGAVIFLATIPVLGIALLHVVLHVNYASIGFMLMLFVMFWGEMMRFSAAHSEQQRSLTRMSESLSQQEKQAILREQTARILAADYDSVFVVNSHAHTLTTLRLTAEYDSLVERLPEEQDFYKRVEDGIRRNIHPEDRDFVARQLAPANVETRLRLQQSFSLVYRTVKDGKSYYNRMKLARGDDPDYFVVGIKNIDPEITKEIESEKQRNTLEMMKVFYGLAEDFACVLQIDTDNGADTLYTITVDLGLPGDFWPASMPYADRMELIKDEFVAPEDRLGFSNATRLENVKIQLDRYKTYYYNFHMIIRGMAQNWQVKYIRSETEPAGLVCGFRNTDREVNIIEQNRRLEKETVRQNDFFNLFAADYVSAFYINLDDGTFTAYKIQPQLEGVLSISDFEAAMGAYIGNVVYEQDRPYMLEVCKRENIKKQLEKADGFSAVFRETLSGQVTYHRLRVKRGSDRLHAAAAFMDVNDEFEREAREKERLERLVEERTSALRSQSEALKRMSTGIVDLLGNVVESRDLSSGQHVRRVRRLTRILATQVMKSCPEYGLTEELVDSITSASALHDLGKIAIPDTVLLKPGSLTPEEFELMKTHSEKGSALLTGMKGYWDPDYLRLSMDICRSHHERWDGRGYPDGLKEDDIPIGAQIVSVVDAYDALTSERVYKSAVSHRKAADMILGGQCGVFSDRLLRCFEASLEEFRNITEKTNNED